MKQLFKTSNLINAAILAGLIVVGIMAYMVIPFLTKANY